VETETRECNGIYSQDFLWTGIHLGEGIWHLILLAAMKFYLYKKYAICISVGKILKNGLQITS
jgi:hypothetical protein